MPRKFTSGRRKTGMNESVRSKASPGAASDRDEGAAFQPKFGADGLATCVTIDASRGDVLMVAHMNEAALRATLATGVVPLLGLGRAAPSGARVTRRAKPRRWLKCAWTATRTHFWPSSMSAGTAAPVIPADGPAFIERSRRTATGLGSCSPQTLPKGDVQPAGAAPQQDFHVNCLATSEAQA